MAEPPVPPSGLPPGGPINNPLHDSGVTPTGPTPEFGRDKPRVGAGEEAQEPKPFSLPPEPGKAQAEGAQQTDKPSPFDLAREGNKQQWSPEEMQDNLAKLHDHFRQASKRLQNPEETKHFTPDHEKALSRLVDLLNPDMRSIAKYSGQQFAPPTQGKGDSVLKWVVKWIDGSQGTLSNAMSNLSTMKKPSVTDFLKLQMSVQRATQRGELFASIVGSGVSGIKTIMSTQMG